MKKLLLLLLLFSACLQREKDTPPPDLRSRGFTVPLDTVNGYTRNVITGDSIIFIDTHLDSLPTGKPIPAIGKVIDMVRVQKPKTIPAGKPKTVPTNTNVHTVGISKTVKIPDTLVTHTPGTDSFSFPKVKKLFTDSASGNSSNQKSQIPNQKSKISNYFPCPKPLPQQDVH